MHIYIRIIELFILYSIIVARYTGAKLRITRRLGVLPGLTSKTTVKDYRPGQHGLAHKETNKKPTEYGLRLEEKQKLIYNYGLSEKALYRYIKEARRMKGVTGLILLQLLEMRLDNICFVLGFGSTIAETRQMVNHGHILVNKKVVSIPSFQVKLKDTIGIKSTSQAMVKNNLDQYTPQSLPKHLVWDSKKLEAKILDYCARDDVKLNLNELLVIEYYSRR